MANLRINVNEDMENHWPFQVLGMTFDGSVVSFYGVWSAHAYTHLLSYDVASGSEITPCNKIDKPQVVYRFTVYIMMSITSLRT